MKKLIALFISVVTVIVLSTTFVFSLPDQYCFQTTGGLKCLNDSATISGTGLDQVFNTVGLLKRTGSNSYSTVMDNSSFWNLAYGYGNHALAGYLIATATTCAGGNYSRFNGTGFSCFSDQNTGGGSSYFAGYGLNLTGTTFNLNKTLTDLLYPSISYVDTTTGNLQTNISNVNTAQLNNNATQAALISALDTRESSNNATQSGLINSGFTNDSTIFTREASDNTTQSALINAGFTNDSTIFTREASDNTTQAALINLRVIAGSCAAGTVVQNTTTGGVQCVTGGSGTVTSVNADAPALLGGAITISGNVSLNLSFLDARYGSTYFYVTQIANNTGTVTGANSNANTVDGLYINVTETTSGLNVTFNFTGVNSSFNGIDFRQKYTADVASQLVLTMYNTLTANYDVLETVGAENNYINSRVPIFNSTPYINSTTNITQLRIYTISTVLSTDILSIDVLTLNKQGLGVEQSNSILGGGTPGYLSLWSDVSTLADSVLNQTLGNLFARNNMTALNFYGNLNWSYLQNLPSYVKDWTADLTAINTSWQVGIGLLQTNITNEDTSWKNSNSTQALQIALINTTELADNSTQSAQINLKLNTALSTNTSICDGTTGKLVQVNWTNGTLIGQCGTDQNTGGGGTTISNISYMPAYYPHLLLGGVGGATPSALDTSARCTDFEVPGYSQVVFNNITTWVRTINTSIDFKFAIYNITSPAKFAATNGTLLINTTWYNMAATGLQGVSNGTTNWILPTGYYAACIATNNTNAMNNAFQGLVNTAGQNGVFTTGVTNGTFPTIVTLTPSAQNMPIIILNNMYGVAK